MEGERKILVRYLDLSREKSRKTTRCACAPPAAAGVVDAAQGRQLPEVCRGGQPEAVLPACTPTRAKAHNPYLDGRVAGDMKIPLDPVPHCCTPTSTNSQSIARKHLTVPVRSAASRRAQSPGGMLPLYPRAQVQCLRRLPDTLRRRQRWMPTRPSARDLRAPSGARTTRTDARHVVLPMPRILRRRGRSRGLPRTGAPADPRSS